MPRTILPLLLLSLLLPLLRPTTAEIKTLEFTSDPRPLILFEQFGFTPFGSVSIVLSHVSASSPSLPPAPFLLGFFLLSDSSFLQAISDRQNHTASPSVSCVLSSPYVRPLFSFADLSPPPLSSYNRSFPIPLPDEYSLYFANCAPDTVVTMSVHTEMFNTLPSGSRDYLSVGQAPVPALYAVFAGVYAIALALWSVTLFCNRLTAHHIHLLMAALLLAKALNLACAAEDQHYIRITGTPHGWDILFYLFQFLRISLLFTVIVLIGTGWSFLKPFLQDREKKVLTTVIPLQVIANIASVVIGETGPFIRDWVTWNQLFLFVDIICCCAIIFPILWSIRTLQETSKTDGKAARNLAKLTLFRRFYTVVVGYLYFTRIVVFALRTIAAYRYRWVSVAAEEVVSFVFYAFMFYMFRPKERNEYFALDNEEEEAAEAALREEEFEL